MIVCPSHRDVKSADARKIPNCPQRTEKQRRKDPETGSISTDHHSFFRRVPCWIGLFRLDLLWIQDFICLWYGRMWRLFSSMPRPTTRVRILLILQVVTIVPRNLTTEYIIWFASLKYYKSYFNNTLTMHHIDSINVLGSTHRRNVGDSNSSLVAPID